MNYNYILFFIIYNRCRKLKICKNYLIITNLLSYLFIYKNNI